MSECNWDPSKHGGKPCPVHGAGGNPGSGGHKIRINNGKYEARLSDDADWEEVSPEEYNDLREGGYQEFDENVDDDFGEFDGEDNVESIIDEMKENGVDISQEGEVVQYLGATLGLDKDDQGGILSYMKENGYFPEEAPVEEEFSTESLIKKAQELGWKEEGIEGIKSLPEEYQRTLYKQLLSAEPARKSEVDEGPGHADMGFKDDDNYEWKETIGEEKSESNEDEKYKEGAKLSTKDGKTIEILEKVPYKEGYVYNCRISTPNEHGALPNVRTTSLYSSELDELVNDDIEMDADKAMEQRKQEEREKLDKEYPDRGDRKVEKEVRDILDKSSNESNYNIDYAYGIDNEDIKNFEDVASKWLRLEDVKAVKPKLDMGGDGSSVYYDIYFNNGDTMVGGIEIDDEHGGRARFVDRSPGALPGAIKHIKNNPDFSGYGSEDKRESAKNKESYQPDSTAKNVARVFLEQKFGYDQDFLNNLTDEDLELAAKFFKKFNIDKVGKK